MKNQLTSIRPPHPAKAGFSTPLLGRQGLLPDPQAGEAPSAAVLDATRATSSDPWWEVQDRTFPVRLVNTIGELTIGVVMDFASGAKTLPAALGYRWGLAKALWS